MLNKSNKQTFFVMRAEAGGPLFQHVTVCHELIKRLRTCVSEYLFRKRLTRSTWSMPTKQETKPELNSNKTELIYFEAGTAIVGTTLIDQVIELTCADTHTTELMALDECGAFILKNLAYQSATATVKLGGASKMFEFNGSGESDLFDNVSPLTYSI